MITTYVHCAEAGFPYVVKTPQRMQDGLPLVIQLHGAGERGNGDAEALPLVEKHGFSAILTEEQEYECVVVMPQCQQDSFWVAQIPVIKEFVLKMISEYQCDPCKVCLTGLSMGGYGTWFTAMAYPDLFAAIAPCCGGGMPWNASVLKMPVWAFHGAEDDVAYPYESENMIDKMRQNGLNPQLTVYENCGHNSWDYAYNEELLYWLIQQEQSRWR